LPDIRPRAKSSGYVAMLAETPARPPLKKAYVWCNFSWGGVSVRCRKIPWYKSLVEKTTALAGKIRNRLAPLPAHNPMIPSFFKMARYKLNTDPDLEECSPVWDNILMRSRGLVAVLAMHPARPPQIIRRVMSVATCPDCWTRVVFLCSVCRSDDDDEDGVIDEDDCMMAAVVTVLNPVID
jgi:hypothetical protein